MKCHSPDHQKKSKGVAHAKEKYRTGLHFIRAHSWTEMYFNTKEKDWKSRNLKEVESQMATWNRWILYVTPGLVVTWNLPFKKWGSEKEGEGAFNSESYAPDTSDLLCGIRSMFERGLRGNSELEVPLEKVHMNWIFTFRWYTGGIKQTK